VYQPAFVLCDDDERRSDATSETNGSKKYQPVVVDKEFTSVGHLGDGPADIRKRK
jgi:hypothetical protein